MGGDPDEQPIRPAATALLVRDTPHGLEVLLAKRAPHLVFHGGSWAFPGGRVEEADGQGLAPTDEEGAARRAAAREVHEEVGLELDPGELVPFSHWTTPPGRPRRFSAWFFLATAPAGEALIDGAETTDHAWRTPAGWLATHAAGEIELPPAPFVSLLRLTGYATADAALDSSRSHPFRRFVSRHHELEDGTVSIFAEDCCYARPGELDVPGPRHRLWMTERPWRYESPW